MVASTTSWSVIGVVGVAAWLVVGVIFVRSRRRGADEATIAKQRWSLIVLTGWVCLVAVRLLTHTYG